jgi:pimeloyl-ACP methyl ester carboxylesterase
VTSREVTVRSDDVSLVGAVFFPARGVAGTILMHPGSGPSDRDNDVYFPPIREHLLEAAVAVCSFDKRGVGASTGRWQEAGIIEQADDLLACLAALEADPTVPKPVGLFGHSQGGWVVVEAASRQPEIAFVVANSGPGVLHWSRNDMPTAPI